jgi:hypothetical protein
MSPETVRWVIGILVTLIVAGATVTVTVLLSVLNRKNDTIAKLQEANLNYRFALLQHAPTAEATNKLLSSIPIPQTDGPGT